MRKFSTKRLIALALTGILSASLLTGCGGGGGKEASTVDFDKNLIYKASYYKKPEELTYLGNIQAGMDGKIYAQSFSEKDQKEVIARINPDDGKVEKMIMNDSKEENSWTMNFIVDKDGNICRLKNNYIMDEKNPENSKTVFKLEKIDAEGKEILNQELDIKEQEFYPDRMEIDNEGTVILSGNNAIYAFDDKGKQAFKIEVPTYVDTMIKDKDGTIYVSNYTEDYTTRIYSKVDKKAKELVEVRRADNAGTGMATLISGKDGMYINDGIFMYSYNIETDEKTKVLNWINSDVNGSNAYNICSLPDGRFVGNTYNELSQENEMIVLKKLPPEEVKDKKLITLAMPYTDYSLKVAVVAFNRQNDEYRILVDDYAQYATAEDYNAGAEKMNTDLISGKMPDLISIGNLPIGTYTSKGLLADLYEKMDGDSEFNRSDYMENIFKAYEKGGKLYSVVPAFNVQTVIAKEDNVGKTPGWTMEDLEKLMADKPEGTEIFKGETQESILMRGLFLATDQYINYTEGTCSFDSGEFAKLLNFAKQFPKENTDAETGAVEVTTSGIPVTEEEDNGLAKDKIMLETCYLYNYNQIHDEKYYNFGGKELTFIGFPTANKQGSAITGNLEVALSSKAAQPDGAWAFIKYLLGDEYQSSRSYEWPMKKSAYAALKEKAQKPDSYIDENGKEQIYENTVFINGKEVKVGKVTDEEVKKVDDLLRSITQVMRYDTNVQEIVSEESGAFFSGQKSAEEVAKLVQNRVQTYLSESK